MVKDYAPQCTFEGDNTVMAQQCARGLIKVVTNLMMGKPATGHSEYLNGIQELTQRKCSAKKSSDFANLELLDEAL